MARLQESFLDGCLRIGRGNGNPISNTVFGFCAGRQYNDATLSASNVAIGHCSGGGTCTKNNVSIGSFAGRNHRQCNYNVFVGYDAGRHDYGYCASKSILLGAQASRQCGAFEIISIGFQSNRYGHGCGAFDGQSIAIGYRAACQSSFGRRNVAIGANSFQNNNGDENTVVGYRVMRVNTTGSCNTAIGDRNHVYSYGASNITSVGFYAYQAYTTSNRGIIGRYSQSKAYVWSAWVNVSDSRDKTDIEYIDDNLSINLMRKLRPVSFKMDFRKSYVNKCGFEFGQKDGTLKQKNETYGFIAQEVKRASEELDIILDLVNHEEFQDSWSLTTMDILPFIIGSIKRLNDEIDDIEKTIEDRG
jgi:hypothetical protein